MTIFEIISGILMIISCLVIIFIVLAQESKGQGLSGVMTGTEMMSNESRSRSKDARLAKATKYAAIVFLVLTILVNISSIMAGS
ncbi:MAG: preprotein translocase subunit SecG [Ruminococcaceae bacterium]|nr:preprotein translocase subunit SecG [Oscillospiraceae bacterium]